MLAPLALGRNDLKQYTSDAFCALLILTVAVWLDPRPRRTPVWWLTVASLAALPFSSTSAFVSVAAFGGVLGSALLVRSRRRAIEVLVNGAITAVGIGGYFAVVVLPNTNEKLRAYWNKYYLRGSPQHMLQQSWTHLSKLGPSLGMPAIVFVVLLVTGVVVLERVHARAVAITIPLLWIEMAVIGILRRYPFLELRTSHFLFVSSLVVCAIGVAGATQLAFRWRRAVGIVAGLLLIVVFTAGVHSRIRKLNIPAEGGRSEAEYVAEHRKPDDVILVNSNGSVHVHAYYWPHGHVSRRRSTSRWAKGSAPRSPGSARCTQRGGRTPTCSPRCAPGSIAGTRRRPEAACTSCART